MSQWLDKNKSACELNQTCFSHSKETKPVQCVTMMLSHTHGNKSKMHRRPDDASLKAPTVLLHDETESTHSMQKITTNSTEHADFQNEKTACYFEHQIVSKN